MSGKKRRGTETLGDMSRSLGLVVAVVALVFLVSRAPGSDEKELRPVTYSDDVASARRAADFPVYAPPQAPPGWTPTSGYVRAAEGEGATVVLRIGFVTAAGSFAGTAQGDGDRQALLDDVAGEEAQEVGDAVVAGLDWQVLRDGDTTSYVRDVDGSTLVVTGDADRAELELLAAALTTG